MENLINLKDKIFIAGASGMVGSAIKNKLLTLGYGNKLLGGEIVYPDSKELDLRDPVKVNNWFKDNKPDIVILAAAKVGGIYANQVQPSTFLLDNLKIEINIIENSWLNKTRRLLFLGSSCIYPKHAKQPIKEEYLLSGPLELTNEGYAIAKIAGLKLCHNLRLQHNFDAISLMPTNLYGPGDNYHPINSHVMAALIKKFCDAKVNNLPEVTCWGSGKPLREFMHVDDLADAAIFSLEKWDPSKTSFSYDEDNNLVSHLNVGTGIDISIKDLSKKIASILDYKGSIVWDKTKPDGTPKKQLDISRLNKLGWEPKINLDSGIQSTISEYMNQYT